MKFRPGTQVKQRNTATQKTAPIDGKEKGKGVGGEICRCI